MVARRVVRVVRINGTAGRSERLGAAKRLVFELGTQIDPGASESDALERQLEF
jgi:hypothetical protein